MSIKRFSSASKMLALGLAVTAAVAMPLSASAAGWGGYHGGYGGYHGGYGRGGYWSGGRWIGGAIVAGVVGGLVYSATKGAVDTVTKSLAKELGPRKIRVNAINPGMIETEGVHAAGIIGGDFQKVAESQTPLGRIGQPEDIATVAAFLASTDSGWITGETILVAGGYR